MVSAANAVTVISSPTFQVVWFWGYCLTKSPESCYHHWSGDFAGGYGGPAVCTLNAVTFFAAIACVAFNFGGLSRCSRHWSVSSSASITWRKLRCDLSRFRYRQHLWVDYRPLFGGFYVTFYVIFALLILSWRSLRRFVSQSRKCCVRRMAPLIICRELLGFSLSVNQTLHAMYKQ